MLIETGDFHVSTIGVNLPNEQEIHAQYGTKNFLLLGSSHALGAAAGGAIDEFAATPEEAQRAKAHGEDAEDMLTAMHEVIGHGSGKLSERVAGELRPSSSRSTYSTLEEARADLMGLWNIWDPKLKELNLVKDQEETAKAMYDSAARAPLTQLRRIPKGDTIEEDHQRDRQLIAHYIKDKTGAIEYFDKDGKTYVRVKDYQKMREGVGQLLAELMRIKAEGDYAAIKTLVDTYGVRFDPKLRDQVVARYKKLNLPSYWAGVNAKLSPVRRRGQERAGHHDQLSARRGPAVPRVRGDVRREPEKMTTPASSNVDTRQYLLERVDEAAVVQLYADGFTALPLREKILIYHLYRAALAGRDIYYDQRYAHNLAMRDVLEEIVTHAGGIPQDTLEEIQRYTKLFWINTGPYNNLTARKFVLKCSPEAFTAAARIAETNGARIPADLASPRTRISSTSRSIPSSRARRPGPGKDILQASANNLYAGVTMADLDGFEERYALNSRLVKTEGKLVEEVYRVGGRYDKYIREIIGHLEAAIPYATEPMAAALRALIRFYETGENADRVAYDIAWVQDRDSPVDTINGFVEVYMDARGMKGAWEALVYYVNPEKTAGIRKLAAAAQWFEDRMPWADEYKKQGVRGVSANAIDVVVEAGDSGPVTPVGINLPNDQTIRELHGSKSVSLSNANQAYDKSTLPEFRREFAWSAEEAERAEKWSSVASELTTEMHEVIGHGSGRIREHLQGNPQGVLKEQVLRARGVARRSRSRSISSPIASSSSSGSSTKPTTTTSSAPSTKATRATRSSSCGASAKGPRSKRTTCATGR